MANTRKVGLKIEIDGEAEYKKAIANINKDNQLLNAELRALAAEYKNNSDSMEYLTQKGEKLESKLVEAEAKVTLLKDALRRATEEYGTADERTTEWAIKLANAETELAKVNNAIADNNAALLENAGALEKNENAVDGLGDQLDELGGMLGVHIPDMAREALNGMEGFSAGTVASMGIAAAGIGSAIAVTKELYELTKKAAAEADALLTRSAQTGLSPELLQQLDYAQQFLDFDGLDKSLQRLTQSMGNATNASTKQAEAFRTLGVSIYDENGNLRDNYDVFLDVIDALGNVESETQRDIIANQLFGKSYAELKPLIQAGSGALKEYTDRAQEMGYAIDKDVIERLGRLNDALDENKTAVDTAKTEVAGFFAPLFQSIIDGGTGAINVVRSLFGSDIVQAMVESSNPLVNIIANWTHLATAYYDAKDAKDAFDESAAESPDLSAAITPMQEAVQALADKYQEAQEKYREMLDGQFGLFEDASERLGSGVDETAQKLAEFWGKAYEAAEKSIQGQFGLFDEASTEVTRTSDDIIKALESQITYWTQYEDNLEAVLSSGIAGIEEFVAAHSDGSAKSVEAIAVLAAATDEEKEQILASWQALQEKQGEVAAGYADMATAGAESAEELAGSTESYAERTIAALESQAQYWQEYNADFDDLKTRNIEGIDELAEKFMDGSADSKDALAELRGASDEEIEKLIASMDKTEQAKSDLAQRFADLAVDVPDELKKIADEFDSTVREINKDATEVDFAPFEESVDSAFSFLEDRAGTSVSTVRGWLAELSAEIDAVEARAANVNVGHNAGGTDNWRGGLTYLAENGPELVDLPQGSRVHTAQETRQILGGGTDMRETEAKLDRAVALLGQISTELSGLRVRGRMA